MRGPSRTSLRRLQLLQYWLVAKIITALLRFLRLFPADKVTNLAGRIARRIGPLTRRHRIALDNLAAALPELSEAERSGIALDMWDNMARLMVEYVFLDWFDRRLADGLDEKYFEFNGIEKFLQIRNEAGPHIFFTAHLGNFELLPVAAARYGMQLTALFRPPNNPFLAQEVARLRNFSDYDMLASHAGSSFTLARILGEGGNIGALIDQKFPKGIRTTFFGRECGTNPLVPKLARHFGCDIYPCRCIRLPGNRFRIEFMDRIDPPRMPDGTIDVAATAQLLNDIVEGWVRETPGQWTWFHRRWELKRNAARQH